MKLTHFRPAPENLTDLRKAYKALSFKHHPDVSGYDSTEAMKQVNTEFDYLSLILTKGMKYEDSERSFNGIYKEKIEALIRMKGIKIEIIGNWLWVSGNTKEYKDTLKELGFKWSPNKIAWYFKSYQYRKMSKTKFEMDDIRGMFGSEEIKTKETHNLEIEA